MPTRNVSLTGCAAHPRAGTALKSYNRPAEILALHRRARISTLSRRATDDCAAS